MVKRAAMCAALFSCLAFAPASASTAPVRPPSFTVKLITANGSGCPLGSALASHATSTGFTVTYSQFIATAGGGASTIGFHQNCQVNLKVGVPAGWTYGIREVGYGGYAHLDRGADGTLSTDYYFAGLPGTQYQNHSIAGPQSGDYGFSDQAHSVMWAPCHYNGTLNVNTSATVLAGSGKSFTNLLLIDHASYYLAFREC